MAVIHAVVFDVGECLVNETREYGTWADWLGDIVAGHDAAHTVITSSFTVGERKGAASRC